MCGRWSGAGGFACLIDPDVAEQIQALALEAFTSLPKRGAEIGGLLLGRVDPGGVVHLESFEAVACEHRYGPAYVLSNEDRAGLEQALARRRSNVVGLYRSYTGRDAEPDHADEILIRQYFPDAPNVFLLLKPLSAVTCASEVRFWHQGKLQSAEQAATAAVAADVAPLAADVAPLAADVAPLAAHVAPPPPPMFACAAPAVSRLHDEDPVEREPGRRMWLLLAIIMMAALAGMLGYFWQKPAGEPRWAPLGLRATTKEGVVELNWNRAAPPVLRAKRGVLAITDGGKQAQFELTGRQVRAGSFSYPASGGSLDFALKLYGPGADVAGDSLRIQQAPAKPAVLPAAPPAPAPVAPIRRHRPAPKPRAPKVLVAPVPLHEVHPGVPAGVQSRIHRQIIVPVTVDIDAFGRVTRAAAQPSGDPLYRYVADYAVAAARWWRFRPARGVNGRSVPANKVLYFAFAP